MQSRSTLIPMAIALSSFLAGCGGGGGSNATAVAVAPTKAEGAYSGTNSNGLEHTTVVLDNDQFYTLYGTTVNGVFRISGLLQGSGKSLNGGFSSTDMKDYYYTGQVFSGAISASYVPSVSFNGTITESGASYAFTGSSINPVSYNYNAGANLANVVGNWSVADLAGTPVALNVSANGTFTTNSSGCITTGTVTPRTSGKNVFDVSLKFGAAPCVLAGQSGTGIALEYLLSNGKRQMVVAVVNAARSNGAVYLGVR